jgi:DNA-binding MarR family transcriptional regulator
VTPLTAAQFAARMMQLMPKLMQSMHAYERNFFTRGTISFPQLWALDYLHDQPRCTMHQFAHAMHNQRSTATGLVDRMAKMGLLRRERSRTDRRVVKVFITPKGNSVMRQIARQRRRIIVRMFSRMSPADRRQYLDIIERLVRQFESPAADLVAPTGART